MGAPAVEANSQGTSKPRTSSKPPAGSDRPSKTSAWPAADLAQLPAEAREAFAALRPAHVAEVAAALGQPGAEVALQYEVESNVAVAFASVLTCATMVGRRVPRPPAQLWEIDWQALASDLEPTEDFTRSLFGTALHLARGGQLEDDTARALWREMNRLPHIWSVPDGGAETCKGTSQGDGTFARLPGLERLRQCVKAIAAMAAPKGTSPE
mmetsp:Transcript_54100/g.87433  ORF Transcript_54100/g.87433 Transcript_54100/m.87433 type:complete len:211 (-) Transcript_54100:31-663(-)